VAGGALGGPGLAGRAPEVVRGGATLFSLRACRFRGRAWGLERRGDSSSAGRLSVAFERGRECVPQATGSNPIRYDVAVLREVRDEKSTMARKTTLRMCQPRHRGGVGSLRFLDWLAVLQGATGTVQTSRQLPIRPSR
jgi:hypothetical protein